MDTDRPDAWHVRLARLRALAIIHHLDPEWGVVLYPMRPPRQRGMVGKAPITCWRLAGGSGTAVDFRDSEILRIKDPGDVLDLLDDRVEAALEKAASNAGGEDG